MPSVEIQLREAIVYRLRDAQSRLLYVGLTRNLKQRLQTHKAKSPWFGAVASVDFDGPLGASLAAWIERSQISRLAPLHNRVGNHRRGWHYPRGGSGIAYFPERDHFYSVDEEVAHGVSRPVTNGAGRAA